MAGCRSRVSGSGLRYREEVLALGRLALKLTKRFDLQYLKLETPSVPACDLHPATCFLPPAACF